MKIGALTAILDITGGGNPVTFLATRVDHLDRRRRTRAMTESGQLHTTNMFQRQVRHVDVEYGTRRQFESLVRLPIGGLSWHYPEPDILQLAFVLPAGCFATVVVRELLDLVPAGQTDTPCEF